MCQFKIPQNRVKFLGWLKNPEEYIGNYAFILDGGIKGHGMMASEAVANGVPVVFPSKYLKDNHSRIKKMYADARPFFKGIRDSEFYSLQYTDMNSLTVIVEKLCSGEIQNNSSASLQRKMLLKRKSENLSIFLNLLDNI